MVRDNRRWWVASTLHHNCFAWFLLFCCLLLLSGCSEPAGPEVVVYTSVDQVYSEPILKEFQRRTGIRVRAVYDVEASKTTGLINRIIAERELPHCDVFWNSEFAGTVRLKKMGLLQNYASPSAQGIPSQFKDSENFWTGFSARAHVIIYNKEMVDKQSAPHSVLELAGPEWNGKVAIAYPLFGTTATYMAVLFKVLGPESAKEFIRDLKGNAPLVVNGNAVARDVVVDGLVPVALTDTDDVNVAKLSGKPVDMIYPDQEGMGTFLIPGTVAIVKGAPHLSEARKLVDYLLDPEVERMLAFSDARQMSLRKWVDKPDDVPDYDSFNAIKVDYEEVAALMPVAAAFCQKVFGCQ